VVGTLCHLLKMIFFQSHVETKGFIQPQNSTEVVERTFQRPKQID